MPSRQLERHLERRRTRLGRQGHSGQGPGQFHPGLSHANRYASHSTTSTLRSRDRPHWPSQGARGRRSDGGSADLLLPFQSQPRAVPPEQYKRRQSPVLQRHTCSPQSKLRSTCRAAPRPLCLETLSSTLGRRWPRHVERAQVARDTCSYLDHQSPPGPLSGAVHATPRL